MVTGSVPWLSMKLGNKRDIYKTISKFCSDGVPFPADVEISTSFKGFIRNCLQFEEYDRFDWFKIFWHPIFNQKFKMIALSNEEFLSGFVITKLRTSIHSQNLNLEALVEELSEEIDV